MKQRQICDKYPQLFSSSAIALPTKIVSVPLEEGWGNRSQKVTPGHLVINIQDKSEVSPQNDLYVSMKPIIILGRIALIIPCSREDSKSNGRPSFSWKVIPYLATIFLLCYCCFQMIFDVQLIFYEPMDNMIGVMKYIPSLRLVLDTIMAIITYLQFLRNSDKFYLIFEKWSEFSSQTEFVKDAWLLPLSYFLAIGVTGVSFASTGVVIADSISGIERLFERANVSLPVLESIFKGRMPGLDKIIPYHPAPYFFFMSCSILSYVTTTYISLLIIFFSRALSFQFRRLIEDATGMKAVDVHLANLQDKDQEFWQTIITKYRVLCQLVTTINTFLSPLIFWWVSWSVYVVSLQLYQAVVGDDFAVIQKETFIPDFLFRTSRFLLAVIGAAKVNTYAMKILMVLRNCPKEYYQDAEVYRLDLEVSTGQTIGLNGMGCFGLTKPFLLQVFGAIFTMEIILLQATQSQPSKSSSR